ncbi:hypothetical protein ACQCLI_32030 (plasmid) [Pseudomonas nitroreducens]|uniref:hypothetical protein n=1 Tax=Pseudomonas nitroreducens TaxID=46680 RepID=UPI000365F06C|nr:hypothetical protein [Pseudomonas nitroreducens]
MKTVALRGNLLNFYVALALGNFSEDQDWAPFDFWEGEIRYRGRSFSPLTQLNDIWPEVIRLRLSTQDAGNGYWLVTLPKKSATRQAFTDAVVTYPSFCVADPLHGYCLAVVWSVFGEDVPNAFESTWAGHVPLELYNVPFDTPVDFDGAVKQYQIAEATKLIDKPAQSPEFPQCIESACKVLGITLQKVRVQTAVKRATIQVNTPSNASALVKALLAAGYKAEACTHNGIHEVLI